VFARGRRGGAAFAASVGVFAAGYAGLVASIWPYIAPFGYTIAAAAADAGVLRGALLGALCALPALVLISAWSVRRARPPAARR
jgi:cytochrome bd-type quinol oxidase subunit 2